MRIMLYRREDALWLRARDISGGKILLLPDNNNTCWIRALFPNRAFQRDEDEGLIVTEELLH